MFGKQSFVAANSPGRHNSDEYNYDDNAADATYVSYQSEIHKRGNINTLMCKSADFVPGQLTLEPQVKSESIATPTRGTSHLRSVSLFEELKKDKNPSEEVGESDDDIAEPQMSLTERATAAL